MDPTQISAAAGLLNQRRCIKLLGTYPYLLVEGAAGFLILRFVPCKLTLDFSGTHPTVHRERAHGAPGWRRQLQVCTGLTHCAAHSKQRERGPCMHTNKAGIPVCHV